MKLLSVYEGSLRFFSFFLAEAYVPVLGHDMRLNYVFVMFLTHAQKKKKGFLTSYLLTHE